MSLDLTLALTGPFAVRIDGRRQKLCLAGKTRALLVMLAAHYNIGLRRDRICDEIWPECPVARAGSALSTGLWRIRNVLAEHVPFSIECVDDIVRLEVDPPAVIDVDRLEQAMAPIAELAPGEPIRDDARDELAAAADLCCGEYLEGSNDHWVLPLRERFCALYITALSALMRDWTLRRDFEHALVYGRTILELDPFREGTQREVMWLYVQNGQRVQAIRQYLALVQLLGDELGIAPMTETQALYRQISGEAISCTSIAPPAPAASMRVFS